MFLYSALQPTRTGRALETRPWVKIRKSRASSNLEKIRPDPKKGGSVLLGYLNTRECHEKNYFPHFFILLGRRQTPWHCTPQARACRFRERFQCCFHVTCSVLSASAMSSAYNPRCSQQCGRLPQLRISRRSRAQSSRQTSWNRSAKRVLASPPFVAARPPATCAPIETAACDEQPGRETRVPMDSSSTAVAHRATSDLHQRPGGTPARALVPNAFVPSGGAIGVDHAAAACLAARSELARRAHFAPGWRFTRSLLACRAPRARDPA